MTVLRLSFDDPGAADAVAQALAGPGGPVGIAAVRAEGMGLLVEFDAARTPLALVVALVDAEVGPQRGRRIAPLDPLDDDALTAFAAALLGEPALDTSRLIETYVEPMLGET